MVKSFTTTGPIIPNEKPEERDLDYTIIVYDKNGLKLKTYKGFTHEKIEVYDRMKYIHY